MRIPEKSLLFMSVFISAMSCFGGGAFARDTNEKKDSGKLTFFDPEDGAFDLSDYIINKKGFVPIPIIITEPALGSFGLGFAPVFIQPNEPIVRDGKTYPVAPDITVGFAAYTANGTWGAGAGRVGYIPSLGAKYTVGAGYINANMDYYFNAPGVNNDKPVQFNIESIPVLLSFSKQLWDPRFSAALQYTFMRNDLKINSGTDSAIIQAINDQIENAISGNINKPALKLEFDGRDNTFTPNNGFMAYVKGDWSNPAFGSDYKYETLKGEAFYYTSFIDSVVSGFHLDIEQSFGDQPFYIKPYVNMRGVATARFQGDSVLAMELEERWDITKRWSLVGFGGAGKAFDDYTKIEDSPWAYGYGAGFRYLLAKKLNLRVGVDVAMGPDGPAWYIVFGSSWIRD